ncbi:hypothetical protein [Xenorhabdus thuongxuanensis]|uniref:Uncharacterized protein n=1 Tax=Xenorhabdus thuongxuanensis TaxID=1873484 RepID=A0A1Q5U3V5_9GAMM|nr:hypothetical protein [Xenorhabdus thuongxuanensis]OKP07162.1 hypothetical protein Xentx_01431 [Xenorhabdus thuongxuanensis]
MKNIILGIILTTNVFPAITHASPVNTLYKKAIGNIVDNPQCNEQEFLLETPHKISDDEDDIQQHSTKFTHDVFVTFSKDTNTKGFNIDISAFPAPKTLNEQLSAFCVISAFQAAIDPSKTTNEYMKLSQKMYSSASKSKNGRDEYQSKNYEHIVHLDKGTDKPTLTFQFYPQGYELPR